MTEGSNFSEAAMRREITPGKEALAREQANYYGIIKNTSRDILLELAKKLAEIKNVELTGGQAAEPEKFLNVEVAAAENLDDLEKLKEVFDKLKIKIED